MISSCSGVYRMWKWALLYQTGTCAIMSVLRTTSVLILMLKHRSVECSIMACRLPISCWHLTGNENIRKSYESRVYKFLTVRLLHSGVKVQVREALNNEISRRRTRINSHFSTIYRITGENSIVFWLSKWLEDYRNFYIPTLLVLWFVIKFSFIHSSKFDETYKTVNITRLYSVASTAFVVSKVKMERRTPSF